MNLRLKIRRAAVLLLIPALLASAGCKAKEPSPDKPESSQRQSSAAPALASSAAPTTSSTPSASAKQSSENKPSSANALPKAKKHIVCLDPGHQEKVDLTKEPVAPGASVTKYKNPGGAQGVATGQVEYALNMIIGEKLKLKLESMGYQVVMTRTDNNADISNIGRAQVANSSGAEIFVRIHADSTDDSSVKGISVQIPGNEYITDAALLTRSRCLGGDLLNSLVKSTCARSRGLVVRNDMTGFNWSKVPVVLVEMGFLSNPEEDRAMSTDAYQNLLVSGFARGIAEYFSTKS